MEVFSTRLDAGPSEPVKPLARPLVSEVTRDNEPERDLNKEFFSARLEATASEPVRDLEKEVFSA